MREMRRQISRCAVYEMEDVVSSVDDVDLLTVPCHPRPFSRGVAKIADILERRTGLRVERLPVAERLDLDRDYDLLSCHSENANDLLLLNRVRNWRERSRVAICRIEELWLADLRHRKLMEQLKVFDAVFLGCEGTAPELERLLGIPVHYLPPSLDQLRFCPYPEPPPRAVDCLSIGRRDAVLHQGILRHAQQRPGFRYVFETREGNSLTADPGQHRVFLADRIHRARYFMVTPAKGNVPEVTAGQQEVGYRFIEGAAAGAVMIGEAPDCNSFRRHLGWQDAVIEAPRSAAEVASLLDELDRDPARLDRARRTNVIESLRRHDCAHRWAEMLGTVGLEPRPALAVRLAELERRIATVPTGANTAGEQVAGISRTGTSAHARGE